MNIRDAVVEDVPEFDRIRRDIFPWHVATVAAQRNWFEVSPPEARRLYLVAEVDGRVEGFAHAGFNVATKEAGVASATVTLHPAHRGRGIGRTLLDRLETHMAEIGVKRAQGYAIDDPATLAWIERQGWAKGASARFSKVDPRSLPPMPAIPEGVEVLPFSAFEPETVYELDIEASADEPGDVSYDGMSYDFWLQRIWGNPDKCADLSMVAVVDGVLASYTLIEGDLSRGRVWSGGTATRPKYRGRGLAKVLKSIALRQAAEAGVTAALTANDYTNGPMLAINDWLGYQVFASEYSVLKSF